MKVSYQQGFAVAQKFYVAVLRPESEVQIPQETKL